MLSLGRLCYHSYSVKMASIVRRVLVMYVVIALLCLTVVSGDVNDGSNVHKNGMAGNMGGNVNLNPNVAKPPLGGAGSRRRLPPDGMRLPAQSGLDSRQRAKPLQFKIAETPECAEDCNKFCNPKTYRNNFAMLDCLQSDVKVMDELSKECHHFIWNYKRNLTKDERFDFAANEVCVNELKEIKECAALQKGQGLIIPCLVENIDNVTSSNCRTYLEKMARIVFSDYRLIHHFVENCQTDIDRYKCGRVGALDEAEDLHSQGKTLECLESNIGQLEVRCKKQVLRTAELQADDYHLDRPLYYACMEARERFCADVAAGDGRIFECLFKHKFDEEMSTSCREKLTVRQQLIVQDVKVEKTFFTACRLDIKQQGCFGSSEDTEVQQASVLICLENAVKRDKVISPECLGEMNDMRRSLMEDYQLSPEIVSKCQEEIKQCAGREGKTIHCLMDLGRPSRDRVHKKGATMSTGCLRALEDLLVETDPASDYRMDLPLQKACQSVVDVACHNIQPGDARIINCLMEKVDTNEMTDECEEKLMEIQYFVARDFRLDHSLYKHCHVDAQNLCSAPKDWKDQHSENPELGPLVFPCLYRHMKERGEDKGLQVSRACKHEIKRVMRQRAKRVELEPEIERECIKDLGQYCSDSDTYHKNEEIQCLQDNYDDLTDKCQEVVANFTEDADEMLELDNILMKACTPMITKFCEEDMEDDTDADDIMDCLIDNKHHPDMNEKCRAGVEHHQLISVKDFKFNHKFKEACKASVMKFCGDKKTKYDVVSCLSEHVRNDTLKESKQRIEKPCRRQLRAEVLERGESIHLDPKLEKACGPDVKEICGDVEKGNAKVLECLKRHQKKLSSKCHKLLFKREKEEAVLGDFKLHSACKSMIKKHCKTEEELGMVQCLRKHKDDPQFDSKCLAVLVRSQITQNTDYRLNPALQKSCKLDIPKFCKSIVKTQKNDDDLEGKVITCLRKQYAAKRLSRDCQEVIKDIVKDSALNYLEDPVLAQACEKEVKDFCNDEHNYALEGSSRGGDSKNKVEMVIESDGRGKVMECLKKKFAEKLITNSECKQQVARVVQESEIDINVDPLLHMACQKDLYRKCGDVSIGEGKQMSCLLAEFEDNPKSLSPDCYKLLKQRKELWEYSAQIAPVEGFQQIYDQISTSPAKLYILGIICAVIGAIFFVGITCGRASKRRQCLCIDKLALHPTDGTAYALLDNYYV